MRLQLTSGPPLLMTPPPPGCSLNMTCVRPLEDPSNLFGEEMCSATGVCTACCRWLLALLAGPC
jgi:hypothetical protein